MHKVYRPPIIELEDGDRYVTGRSPGVCATLLCNNTVDRSIFWLSTAALQQPKWLSEVTQGHQVSDHMVR